MSELGIPYLLSATVVGLVVGTFSGLFGVGGGLPMVPAFVYIFGKETHEAMATSLAAIVPIALAGTARYALSGETEVNYKVLATVFVVICTASIIGGILLAKYCPPAGKVDFRLATAMAIGSLAGAFFIGVPIAKLIPAGKLAKLFGLLIVVIGLRMTRVIPWLLAHLPSRGEPSI